MARVRGLLDRVADMVRTQSRLRRVGIGAKIARVPELDGAGLIAIEVEVSDAAEVLARRILSAASIR